MQNGSSETLIGWKSGMPLFGTELRDRGYGLGILSFLWKLYCKNLFSQIFNGQKAIFLAVRKFRSLCNQKHCIIPYVLTAEKS
jgi:hypothetical protein